MAHWLKSLLSPRSIAIVGASDRIGSLALSTYQLLLDAGYRGAIYTVNPKYQQLYDQPCYASLKALPEVPDLVVYAISGLALETSFDEALEIGVGGILIYASNHLENEKSPVLTERLKQKAANSGVPVCGGNSMGFYNYDDSVFVSFDRPPPDRPKGHIGLILHSGSGLTYLANNDKRFCYNYVIASAQETNGTVGDYIDYLLDQRSTRVIAIMLEAIRDVPCFVNALKKAQKMNIPVVITKLGRTEKSAQLAMSHSGAMVGNYEAFVATCERYDVVLCNDIDEMIVTAMLFAVDVRPGIGGVASILDSGGMREQMIDLAADYNIQFAEINAHTRQIIGEYLDAGLSVDNPLDAMGALASHISQTYFECGKALLDDPDTALLTFEFEFRDDFSHYPELFEVVEKLSAYNEKRVIVLNSCSFTSVDETAARLTRQGIPVINGIDVALRAIGNLLLYHPVSHTDRQLDDSCSGQKISLWKKRLSQNDSLDELKSLELMTDFGLPTAMYRFAENKNQLVVAANELGYPLVMKTAESGIHHKSDCDGVILSISNQETLESSYRNLINRLGRRVLLMPMITGDVEISVGMKNDPQYGPLVIVASGGILIELIDDRAFALAPVNHQQANELLSGLKVSKLLDGFRGKPAVDRQALVDLIVKFSEIAFSLSDVIQEIDLNPVMVNQHGCTIVDALVISKR